MANLKVPSLQHLARNWRDNPVLIRNVLVRLARNPPIFNYNPLFGAVRDLLVLRVPYEQVTAGIGKIKRADVRANLLSVLPLIQKHFADVSPDFFQGVDRRYYPVSRELMVPFDPPMIYGIGGQFYFPWFSFWRRNPLAAKRLSLFVTLVDEVLLQDPDLESARFEILDFSVPGKSGDRELTVIDSREIPRVSEAEKGEMLRVFAEGFAQAVAELREPAQPDASSEDDDRASKSDPDQPDFFGK